MQAISCTVPTVIALTDHFVVIALVRCHAALADSYQLLFRGNDWFKGQVARSGGFSQLLYCIDKDHVNWRFMFSKRFLCTLLLPILLVWIAERIILLL